jgi:small subunit ribosomal protein S20
MAITSSAKRAIRVSARKHVQNIRRTETMKGEVKTLRKLAEGGKAKEAEAALSLAYKAIDKAAKTGVIKKNTAARKKSRLVAFMKKQAAKPVVEKAPKKPKAVKK